MDELRAERDRLYSALETALVAMRVAGAQSTFSGLHQAYTGGCAVLEASDRVSRPIIATVNAQMPSMRLG